METEIKKAILAAGLKPLKTKNQWNMDSEFIKHKKRGCGYYIYDTKYEGVDDSDNWKEQLDEFVKYFKGAKKSTYSTIDDDHVAFEYRGKAVELKNKTLVYYLDIYLRNIGYAHPFIVVSSPADGAMFMFC